MKVNKKSWHYKAVNFTLDHLPVALCWYFWATVLSVCWIIFIAVVATALACCIVLMITYPAWQWFFPNFLVQFMQTGGIIIWLLIGGTILYNYRDYLKSEGLIKPKPAGLVAQYISAKHRKICPIIKYE